MQSRTTRPDWFQTVPLTRAIDPQFDMVEYFADLEIDPDAADVIKEVLRLSGLFRRSALTKKRIALQEVPSKQNYKELISEISEHYLEPDTECAELNDKIDELDESGCGNYWNLLADYKGFQVLENINGELLVSQPDGPCFRTGDAFQRLYKFEDHERQDIALVDAQEFIDAFVLSVPAIGQLSLPI